MMNILRFFVMTLKILVRVCLTSDYVYIGCFVDDEDRVLRTAEYKNRSKMSADICYRFCKERCSSRGTCTHFGTEYSWECFCGNGSNLYQASYMNKTDSECNKKCAGKKSENCGADWRISIYAFSLSTINNSVVQNKVTARSSQLSAVELGAAIGVPVLFVIILIIGYFIYRRRRSKYIQNDAKGTVDAMNSHDYKSNPTANPAHDMPTSYSEIDIYNNSHKYQDLNSASNSPFKADLSYDYVATPLNAVSKQPYKGNLNTESPHIQNEKKSKETTYFVLEALQNTCRLPFTESSTEAPSTSYAVLDPGVTGYNRLNKRGIENSYEFSQPISDKRHDIAMPFPEKTKENRDEYDSCDTMNKKRWDIPGENVYSHTVDGTYDCSSYKRQEDTSGDTYDHLIGEKTEDEYDITKRH